MSIAAALSKQTAEFVERRSCRREPLNCVVLTFFDQNNWGKLIDLSEKGMSIEFAQPPKVREPIQFTFEAMGCMPLPRGGKIFGEPIRIAGQVIWIREFERTAGVRFVHLAEKSRKQIRHWISEESWQDLPSLGQELRSEISQEIAPPASLPKPLNPEPATPEPPRPEPLGPEPPSPKSVASAAESPYDPTGEFPGPALHDLEIEVELPQDAELPAGAESHSEIGLLQEPERASTPERLEPLALEASSSEQYDEQLTRDDAVRFSRRWTLLGVLGMLGCLAVLGVVAGVRRMTPSSPQGTTVAAKVATPSQNQVSPNQLAAVVEVNRLVPKSTEGSAANRSVATPSEPPANTSRASERQASTNGVIEQAGAEKQISSTNLHPFLVEVLDTDNRRSILSFSNDGSRNVSSRVVRNAGSDAAPSNAQETSSAEKAAASQNPGPARNFALISPNIRQTLSNPSTNNSLSAAAPTMEGGTSVPTAPPITDIGALARVVAPVERNSFTGGDVQPARLMRAMPPIYPQLARANRIEGDVTLDALIDVAGSVQDATVISGPLLLREAAKQALHEWKYQPARLDGTPVAMHLTVTIKFRLNK